MFRLAPRSLLSTASKRVVRQSSRSKSSSAGTSGPSVLEGDAGKLATRVHHAMTTSLAVLTPVVFLIPDSYTDGVVNKSLGVFLSANIAAHSWVGLNYVATDYVPKISKALLGPARFLNAGIAVITLVGLTKISLMSPGGLKGAVKGLWNPKPPKKDIYDF
jgi:succinate dehydrogenase hydrophobic anchor subunit